MDLVQVGLLTPGNEPSAYQIKVKIWWIHCQHVIDTWSKFQMILITCWWYTPRWLDRPPPPPSRTSTTPPCFPVNGSIWKFNQFINYICKVVPEIFNRFQQGLHSENWSLRSGGLIVNPPPIILCYVVSSRCVFADRSELELEMILDTCLIKVGKLWIWSMKASWWNTPPCVQYSLRVGPHLLA